MLGSLLVLGPSTALRKVGPSVTRACAHCAASGGSEELEEARHLQWMLSQMTDEEHLANADSAERVFTGLSFGGAEETVPGLVTNSEPMSAALANSEPMSAALEGASSDAVRSVSDLDMDTLKHSFAELAAEEVNSAERLWKEAFGDEAAITNVSQDDPNGDGYDGFEWGGTF